jgi:hypothetical protein
MIGAWRTDGATAPFRTGQNNLQSAYDLSLARQRIGAAVAAEVQPMAA